MIRPVYGTRLKKHGKARAEAARGQIAVTPDDFKLIPQIVSAPDGIDRVGVSGIGRALIRHTKRIGDAYYVVEEVRTGRKTLALETMYKRK